MPPPSRRANRSRHGSRAGGSLRPSRSDTTMTHELPARRPRAEHAAAPAAALARKIFSGAGRGVLARLLAAAAPLFAPPSAPHWLPRGLPGPGGAGWGPV